MGGCIICIIKCHSRLYGRSFNFIWCIVFRFWASIWISDLSEWIFGFVSLCLQFHICNLVRECTMFSGCVCSRSWNPNNLLLEFWSLLVA